MKYALSDSLKNHLKWLELLKLKMQEAEYVEFNTLFAYNDLIPELEALKVDLIAEGRRKDKLYASGKFRRYNLTQRMKDFLLSKSYASWSGFQFEDLSLLKGNKEILATITHENYIFILTTEEERKKLNEAGFDFGELFDLPSSKC